MSATSFRRIAAFFLLCLALSTPWASAGQWPTSAATAASPAHLLNRLWSFLTTVWDKTGCYIDPDGLCAAPASPNLDTGCRFDPDGRCVTSASPRLDEGCRADPDGRCMPLALPRGDEGCYIDPNGRCGS